MLIFIGIRVIIGILSGIIYGESYGSCRQTYEGY